jgi:DNA-binding SARP family transcriptional activator
VNKALQVKLLGGFSVWVNGVLIPDEQWRSRRVRSLVKLLALTPGQRLQRDQVLDTLWPDSDFTAAANNLHQTLFNARRIFDTAGAACLVLEDGLLSLGNGTSVDVEQFEAAAARAQKSQDPALFQAALALYSGDLLPEDLYEEWAVQRRESLHQLRLKLLLDLAGLLETCGETAAAINALGQVVVLDRAHEEAHTRLMRLYALTGQRQQALRQFQLLREALRRTGD